MLRKLVVKNYALIDAREVYFEQGFNVITGETGSGKSLLLGALGLLLGQQADYSKLNSKSLKCISEGTFDISSYGLQDFFEQLDIDYDDSTIVRRELSPSGKSRAFINDTPVNLTALKAFTSELIDIHSQHDNHKISSKAFMYKVLDGYAGIDKDVSKYAAGLAELKLIKKEFEDLKSKEAALKADRDYYEFQFNELNQIDLEAIQLDELEAELNLLSNAEEVKSIIYNAEQILSDDDGALALLKKSYDTLSSFKQPDEELDGLLEKLNSLRLELEDVSFDVRKKYDAITPDESRLAEITELVDQSNTLLIKHRAKDISELIEKKEHFAVMLSTADNFDGEIQRILQKIEAKESSLNTVTSKLHTKRVSQGKQLSSAINSGLSELGMSHSEFKVHVEVSEEFNEFGKSHLTFLVKTNKGSEFSPLGNVASGGEISRIMFMIKAAVASKKNIATLILDEIDTGISGEVASKLATQIRKMGQTSQLLVVSHLAQMAGKAHTHYKVSKIEQSNSTTTVLEKLESRKEVVAELANILSGDSVTDAAISNAESLLLEN